MTNLFFFLLLFQFLLLAFHPVNKCLCFCKCTLNILTHLYFKGSLLPQAFARLTKLVPLWRWIRQEFYESWRERHCHIHSLTPGPGSGGTYRRKILFRWEADDSESTDQRKCGLTGCCIKTPPPRVTLWPFFSYYSSFPPCVNVWKTLFSLVPLPSRTVIFISASTDLAVHALLCSGSEWLLWQHLSHPAPLLSYYAFMVAVCFGL